MNNLSGWVKLHRKLSNKAFYSKDSEMVHLWVHLLISANHRGREESLGGKPFVCNPGQFTTGRKQLSKETGISESKIERILFKFENIEQQIEQQKTSTNRLISILNWIEYQDDEHQCEQQPNNDRTTSGQRVDTPKEIKNVKKEKNNNTLEIFKKSVSEFVPLYGKDMCKEFYLYWTEPTPSGLKVRFQLEKTWDTSRRLMTWKRNKDRFVTTKQKSDNSVEGMIIPELPIPVRK